MCRMFGMIGQAPGAAARQLVRDAARGLRALAVEHADGWGLAVRGDGDWIVQRSTAGAASCERYEELASRVEAPVVIAHVRKATVGARTLANTHPFRRGRFVFAHNGTVRELAAITARTAPEQLAAVEGDTDSERLLAFVLTFVDEAPCVERGVAAAVRALHALGDVGATSFLLSCGERLYAHRCGRSLFTLEQDGVALVASEPLTGAAWRELPERALIAWGGRGDHALAA